jgi:hypothetical protein
MKKLDESDGIGARRGWDEEDIVIVGCMNEMRD